VIDVVALARLKQAPAREAAMRLLLAMSLLVAFGCAAPVAVEPASAGGEGTVDAAPADSSLPPDLGTRKAGVDWPRFLGPTADSVSPEKGILTAWSADSPRVLWDKKPGTGYSVPSISRGRMFLFDRIRDRARLMAFKSETGEELWTFDYQTDYKDLYNYNNGPRCCPVVDGDRVYICGAEGMLHCVRAVDGKLVWKVDTRTAFGVVQNFFGVGSTPAIEGDLLLVQVGGSPPGSGDSPEMDQKGNGSGLVAFDKFTGKVRYKVTDELASYASPVLATISSRRWCFLFARGGLVGLDPATGNVDFQFPWRARTLESVNAANPLVVGDRVLISETYGPGSALLKIKPGGCETIWSDATKGRDKSLQCHWNTPIHVNGYVYGSSGRHPNNAELRCVELATGKVMWSEPGLTRTSLMLVDGYFLCLGEEGTLHLLKVNRAKYEEVAVATLKSKEGEPLLQYPCWAAPILSHGLLYLRGGNRLVCLELIPETK
jgi:outer membrane protein assembly factor BamB